MENNLNALRFCEESGSSRLCVRAGPETHERQFGVMCQIHRVFGAEIEVRIIARCEPITTPEIHVTGGYLVSRFREVEDDAQNEDEKTNSIGILVKLREEIDKQWQLIGQAGRQRLMSRMERQVPGLMTSSETILFTASDHDQLRRSLMRLARFDKISFLLMQMVLRSDSTVRESCISSKNTGDRLSLVLAHMRNRNPSFVLEVDEGTPPGRELFRLNSLSSAFLVFLVVILLLALKGMGYLERRNYRF